MNDEVFEKVFERIEDVYFVLGDYEFDLSVEKRKEKLKEILEEIYQKGKDDKFKVGYLDVDEFYPDNEKEAKL